MYLYIHQMYTICILISCNFSLIKKKYSIKNPEKHSLWHLLLPSRTVIGTYCYQAAGYWHLLLPSCTVIGTYCYQGVQVLAFTFTKLYSYWHLL
jgi:hypothetical protein